jgi:hypothetical protein
MTRQSVERLLLRAVTVKEARPPRYSDEDHEYRSPVVLTSSHWIGRAVILTTIPRYDLVERLSGRDHLFRRSDFQRYNRPGGFHSKPGAARGVPR